MAPDRSEAVVSTDHRPSETTTETSMAVPTIRGSVHSIPLPSSSTSDSVATESSRASHIDTWNKGTRTDSNNNNDGGQSGTHQLTQLSQYANGAFSQSDPRSTDGSQASNATTISDQVFTPTHTGEPAPLPSVASESGPESQLLQLSELAAGQQRMRADSAAAASRKRTADGLVKSPVRGGGHSRTTSSVSAVSTASTIGEIASNLRNNLSWAAYKHKNGWGDKSFNEIETMVQSSQSTSPTSANSALAPGHFRRGSSASLQFAHDSRDRQHKAGSPPSLHANKPTLAPPAPIQPSAGASSNPRRNSSPRHTPSLLSHTHSGSPRTPAQPHPSQAAGNRLGALQTTDFPLFPPHQDTREKDTVEALMFLSSPNNSANLKHSFSPAGSPGPHSHSQPTPRSNGRHALPSGPRKALPNHRPAAVPRRVEFEASPQPHHSPMMLDTPATTYSSPNKEPSRKRPNGEPGHFRSSLSLDAVMIRKSVPARKPLTDADVMKMLDRGMDPMDMSSDDEEIIIPLRRQPPVPHLH